MRIAGDLETPQRQNAVAFAMRTMSADG